MRENGEEFLYEKRETLVTDNEKEYLEAIDEALPDDCLIVPQANLAAFIDRTDDARFRNELFRNVDFLITDLSYHPLFVVEINDKTHKEQNRRERDWKVSQICQEAGIPIVTFWTSYGVNYDYIQKQLLKTLESLPVERVHHFKVENEKNTVKEKKTEKGCYVATCVYGSYDCPQVWTLRRFRDGYLEPRRCGRAFIRWYYRVSPALVARFGSNRFFRQVCRAWLDCFVCGLNKRGWKDTPYVDSQKKKQLPSR